MKIIVKFEVPSDLSYETTGLSQEEVEYAQKCVEKYFGLHEKVHIEIDTETYEAKVSKI